MKKSEKIEGSLTCQWWRQSDDQVSYMLHIDRLGRLVELTHCAGHLPKWTKMCKQLEKSGASIPHPRRFFIYPYPVNRLGIHSLFREHLAHRWSFDRVARRGWRADHAGLLVWNLDRGHVVQLADRLLGQLDSVEGRHVLVRPVLCLLLL